MRTIPAAPEELAYCAGVIDSDGCIRIKLHSGSYGPCISCRQVALEATDLLHELFGGGRHKAKPPLGTNLRVQTGWAVTHRGAAVCAEQLLPYLRIKRRQAEIAIEVAGLTGWKVEEVRRRQREQEALSLAAEVWMTLPEIAEVTGRSLNSLYAATRSHRLVSRKIGHRRMIAAACVPYLLLPSIHKRPAELTARLHNLWDEARRLNRVGRFE